MSRPTSTRPALALLPVLTLLALAASTPAQAEPFTYQGLLRDSGSATADYDFEVVLYDAASDGGVVAGPFSFDNVALDNGRALLEIDPPGTTFTGPDRWLELRVRRGPDDLQPYTTLLPRQKLHPTPYAQHASDADFAAQVAPDSVTSTEISVAAVGSAQLADGSVTTTKLAGGAVSSAKIANGAIGLSQINQTQVQVRASDTCNANSAIGWIGQDGSIGCNNFPSVAGLWSTSGNAGTDPSTQFLGTTDNQALEIRVANARALRVEPSSITFGGLPSTANMIGGSRANSTSTWVRGGTIGGGGVPVGDSDPDFAGEAPNRVTDHYATVGGGFGNVAGNDSNDSAGYMATVAGGGGNTASASNSAIGGGSGNTSNGPNSTVAGGAANTAAGSGAGIGGGSGNTAGGAYSHIGGGFGNTAGNELATVGGGTGNTVNGIRAAVLGGESNLASASFASIGGGSGNNASGSYAHIGGGQNNSASNTTTMIGGGIGNQASGESAAIAGGVNNIASGLRSSIGGGENNSASEDWSTVAGGGSNQADGYMTSIGGGNGNSAAGNYAVVAGGDNNNASGHQASIGGGQNNVASGSNASIAGGSGNTAFGTSSAVIGGYDNCAGANYSFAGGHRAKVVPGTNPNDGGPCSGLSGYPGGTVGHKGSFVWADSTDSDFQSMGANRFDVRATGGVRFVSGYGCLGPCVEQGVKLDPGSGSWANLSDRNAKSDIEAIDPRDVLARVLALPIYTWRYNAQDSGIRHMGPMAQDFHAAFELNGDDDRTIATVDPDGVALAAIQGLHGEIQTLRDENADLRGQLADLVRRLQKLEHRSPVK